MVWIDLVIQGVLLGSLYALFATGLSLIFGVMRLVNLAHGDLIVVAAFVALAVVEGIGLHPLLSLVIVVPAMFGFGYVLQRSIFNRTLGNDVLPPLLVSFGLSIIIQNLLLELFSADSRKLQTGALETASVELGGGLSIGYFPVMILLTAVVVVAGLQFLFYRTELGRAFRATSDDPEMARVMGVDNRHIFGLAMAIAMAVVAIAGVFLAARTNFDPTIGPARLLYAFEAVIVGGPGNLWGTLLGGIILGIAQSIGAKIDPGLQILAGHVVFLLVLAVRPNGLFPRVRDL